MAWEQELSWCIILSIHTKSLLSLSALCLHQTFHGPASFNGLYFVAIGGIHSLHLST